MFQVEKKASAAEQLISDILHAQKEAMLLVREKDGQPIAANDKALSLQSGFNLPELRSLIGEHGEANVEVKDSNGHTYELTCKKLRWLDGDPVLLFIFDESVNTRKELKKLYNLAYIDGLTQVPNRLKLKETFTELENGIIEGKICGAVSIIDFDYFKTINDTYGHNVGDMMLHKSIMRLNENPEFRGNLYRLGGDEFTLLFVEKTGTYPNLREHYEKVMSGVLGTYTLPNIDLACTITGGVAFFPQHGTTLSPLLHNADIALYKAKAAGRNRVMFFEEDDVAQDLKGLYVNSQPILDEVGNTFGYELIEGSADKKMAAKISLISFNRTLEILGLNEIENNNRYFINYTKNMAAQAAGQSRFKHQFIIQISVTDHCGEEEMLNYGKLRDLGFALAMNCSNIDFLSYELIALAKYVKISPNESIAEPLKEIQSKHQEVTFIGVGINDRQQLDFAKQVGCSLFEGFYFQAATENEPLYTNYYRLLKLVCTDESSELTLSERPLELARISLLRAKFGENLVAYFKVPRNPDHVFTLGMLSLAKEQVVDEFTLPPEILASLKTNEGKYSDILTFLNNYEHSLWNEVSKFAKDNGLNNKVINEAYLAATKWYNELTRDS